MPKPKKKRTKRYDPTRYAEKPPRMSLQTAEEIKGMYRDVQLAVELRLHRGEFERPDVLNLGSTILLATFCLYRGYGVDGEYLVGEYGTEWVAMQEAFKSFSQRAEKRGALPAKPMSSTPFAQGWRSRAKSSAHASMPIRCASLSFSCAPRI